jgi:hypothetical protein
MKLNRFELWPVDLSKLTPSEREMILGKPVADLLEECTGEALAEFEVLDVDFDNNTITIGAK